MGALVLLAASFGVQATAQELAASPLVTVLTLEGAIGPASADYVERGLERAKEGAALVVLRMGSHGDRGLKRLLLGSVASRVVATADRPVIV